MVMLSFGRRSKIRNLKTQADHARDCKDWPKAAQLYKQVLDYSPDLAAIWVQYGHALKEQGGVKEAEQAYRQALVFDANNADTYLQLGHALKLQGFYEEALESYLQGAEYDPENSDLQSEIGNLRNLYETDNNIGIGENFLNEYKYLLKDINLEIKNKNISRRREFNSLKEFFSYYKILPKVVEIFDYQYYFYANIGVQKDLKDISLSKCLLHFVEKGISDLNTIKSNYDFDPDFYRSTYSMDKLTNNEGLYHHWLREGISREFWPNRKLFARSLLGYAAAYVDTIDLSTYAITRGRSIKEWGWSEVLLDFISNSVTDVNQIKYITSENLPVFLEIADRFAREGKDDRALLVYERILSIVPDHTRALHHYGDVLIRKGCYFAAAQSLERAITTLYPNPWSFLNLANCEEKLGRFERVAEIIYQATKVFPGDMGFKRQLWDKVSALAGHVWQDAVALATAGDISKAQDHIASVHRHIAEFTSVVDPVEAMPVSSVALFANQHLRQCTFYRVEQKVEQLEQAGLKVEVFDQDTGLNDFLSAAHRFQAAIFYRVPALPNILRAIGTAKALGMITFYEIDDLIFNKTLYPPPFANYAGMINANEYIGLALGVPLFLVAMEQCDFAIASTPALAEQMRKVVPNKRVFLHRNGLDSRHLAAARSAGVSFSNKKVTIFYGSGTRAHKEDFYDLVEPALVEMVRRYGKRIQIVIAGYPPPVKRLVDCGAEILVIDTMLEPAKYWAMLGGADINLAVLHSTELTDTKSEIKWLEAAIMGVPSVVSATQTYREVVEEGVDGFLCSTPEEWTKALDLLVSSPERRYAVGEAARKKALKNYSPGALGENIRRIIQSVAPPARKKRRLLIVNVFYPPQAIGGATRVVHDNVRDLVKQYGDEFHIEVVSTIEGGTEPYQVRSHAQDGVRVHGITTPDRPDIDHVIHDPQMGIVFDDMLTEIKPDLVHFHCIQRLTLSVVEACQIRSIPYFVTVHDGWWISRSQFLVNDRTDKLDIFQFEETLESISKVGAENVISEISDFSAKRGALKQAISVLAVSKSFMEIYKQCGVENVKTVANGLSIFSKLPRTSDPDGYVRLGFVGGLSKHKGFHLINYALSGNRFKNLRLIAIDHGAPEGTLRHEIWGTTPVEFRPKVKQSEVASLYADIDVLLAPSIWPESFGLVTREANLCGCWVIASDRGAIGEDVIENVNGFRIDVSSPTALARTLSKIDADPQRYRVPAPTVTNMRLASAQAKDLAHLYRTVVLSSAENIAPKEKPFHKQSNVTSVV